MHWPRKSKDFVQHGKAFDLMSQHGLDETKVLFSDLRLSGEVDVSAATKALKDRYWLYGLAPKSVHLQATPNGTSMMRVQYWGETELYLIKGKDCLASAPQEARSDCDKLKKWLEDLTEPTYKDVKATMAIHKVVMKPAMVVYVPAGFIFIERVINGQLIGGVRRSFVHAEAKDDALAARELLVNAFGSKADRFDKIWSVVGPKT